MPIYSDKDPIVAIATASGRGGVGRRAALCHHLQRRGGGGTCHGQGRIHQRDCMGAGAGDF